MTLQVSGSGYYALSEHMHDVTWRTGYQLGTGIDVVTGTAARCAVKEFALSPSPRPHVAFSTKTILCKSEQVVWDAVSFSTGATAACFNIEPLNVRASFGGTLDALRSIRKSSTSFSLLVLSTKRWGERLGINFELTDEALNQAREHPDSFRDIYGDYFIAGASEGAIFAAVLTWTCVDRETCRLVEAEVQAKLDLNPAVAGFDAHLGSVLDRLAKERRIHVTIQIGMRGTDSTAHASFPVGGQGLTEISQIYGPLEWFQQHAIGETVSAILCPYTRLAFPLSLPHALPVPDTVFLELAKIRAALLECQFRIDSIPAAMMRHSVLNYLRDKCISLAGQCADFYQPMLPYDDTRRQALLASIVDLLQRLREFESVQDFFLTVRAAKRAELTGVVQRAREGKTWEYGCPSPSAAGEKEFISVYKLQPEARTVKGRLYPNSSNVVAAIRPEAGEHIVGWTVTSMQSRGSWRKLSPQIIFAREAAIKFRRGLRTAAWQFTVYVIKNQFFDALCQHEPSANGSTLDTREKPETPEKPGWKLTSLWKCF
ncbi:hypothetical protein AURDEDRAFT_168291 [Auricularia subglabra TFB-10046 SS5]|nr:hypothetical protein AURDEDRAFT_168291 [Auricularia subglabra TFB-10046 SS5]